MYRLHIDIPLGQNEEEAVRITESLMRWTFEDVDCKTRLKMLTFDGIDQINYRLGHDEDRQKSNYLDKNENGHCSNKKTKISI